MRTGRDSVYFEVGVTEEEGSTGSVTEKNAVFVYADTRLPVHSAPIFLKWRVEGVYNFRETDYPNSFHDPPRTCFITQYLNPQNIQLFSTRESDAHCIQKQLITVKKVTRAEFYRRYYFNVIVSSITGRRYLYWKQVDELINRAGTIFDTPGFSDRKHF